MNYCSAEIQRKSAFFKMSSVSSSCWKKSPVFLKMSVQPHSCEYIVWIREYLLKSQIHTIYLVNFSLPGLFFPTLHSGPRFPFLCKLRPRDSSRYIFACQATPSLSFQIISYSSNSSQWRNRRGGGGRGGRVPLRDFWPGNFCWRIGKKEARKKGKRGENWEEKVENWKWKQENMRKRGEDLFFFFFFFFLLFTFEKDKNLFWVYQNGNFLPGKSISRREKNQEKWLCPLRKICLLRPW